MSKQSSKIFMMTGRTNSSNLINLIQNHLHPRTMPELSGCSAQDKRQHRHIIRMVSLTCTTQDHQRLFLLIVRSLTITTVTMSTVTVKELSWEDCLLTGI